MSSSSITQDHSDEAEERGDEAQEEEQVQQEEEQEEQQAHVVAYLDLVVEGRPAATTVTSGKARDNSRDASPCCGRCAACAFRWRRQNALAPR